MTTLQDHQIPRDLVECLRIEANHARNPPTEYLVADDGGRMVHKPKPAMRELAATTLKDTRHD